jgi:hypothetical protein
MATRFTLTVDAARPVLSVAFPELNEDTQNRRYLAFDATADETAEWGPFVVPQNVSGAWTAIVHYYMATATSASVRVQIQIECVTPGDALDMDSARSFDTATSAGDVVPGTGQYPDSFSLSLNMDSAAAGDRMWVRFNRDADGTSGTDDATGDMRVTAIELRDSA